MMSETELLEHYHSYVRSTAQNWFRARSSDQLEMCESFAAMALQCRAEAFLAAQVLGMPLADAQKDIRSRLDYLVREAAGE